ncbi:hypothetical protein EAH72_29325 [Pseudomonas caspiana]|nr:hypothetical protein [Pseudomonas caspiana]TPG90307.1 hypothetical protein EAH72_29325 [Pseudomonas caspiana]
MRQPKTRRALCAQIILWATLLTLAVIVIGLLGIEAADGINDWSQWLRGQAFALLIWRLALYSVVAYGWYRMRQRLAHEGLTSSQHQRLLCTEAAAVAAIAVLELMTFSSN